MHAFVKPDGHYMNDLWFYDINAHRWICLYPGIDTRTITQRIRDKELTVNSDGALVEKTGEPVPPLLIHAYGGYDPATNAFYCHFASDSRDDGTMWVYRYEWR